MVAQHPLSRVRSFLAHPSVRRTTGALGGVSVVLLLILATMPPGGVVAVHRIGAPGMPVVRSSLPAGWAIHQGHAAAVRSGPVPGSSPAPAATYEVCNWGAIINGTNPPPQPGYCFNFTVNDTFCAAPPANATLADLGLNLTVASSPANGTGAAPMNFTWNISVNGGGLPPYLVQLAIYSAGMTYLTTNLTGALPLTVAGLYEVDVMAEDSSCSQTSYVAFTVNAYDPVLGPNPVHVTANASSPTVPSTVAYSVNMTGVPAGIGVLWTTPGFFGGNGSQTYFLPGTYSATACFYWENTSGANGSILACGTSPNVTLSGVSPVTSTITIAPGPFPTNVTFSILLANSTGLPNDTQLDLLVYNNQQLGTWNFSNTSSASVTVAVGCGRPWTMYVPPNGICPIVADFSLFDPSRSLDAGDLGFGVLVANLTANGTPSLWNPSVSYSYGPLNGSLPFNLTVNLTATNGQSPYSYGTVLYGRTSGAANATQYPTINSTGYNWNGSTLSLTFTFNRTGVYYLAIFVYDQDDAWVGFALPLIILGNVSAAGPLVVSASGGAGPGSGGAPEADVDTAFTAKATGGIGPYSVQWSFGDGAYGSSIPGLPVYHAYAVPGTYVPQVTVTDGRGTAVTTFLAPVTVLANPHAAGSAGGTPAPTGAGPWGPVLWAGVLGVALLAMGSLAAREEVRRQGEALADAIEDGTADPPRGPSARR
ncbi:MAG TPA: PKD domain-containing protein [Thermoplasmata archaeon]|nr:PKD domain-containing protein [Thermoplasmata archaeon]